MKKIYLLFPIVLLMTGCNVEYNIDIDSTLAKENVIINYENSVENDSIVNNLNVNKFAAYKDANADNYYKISKKNDIDSSSVDFKYNFPLEKLLYSAAINKCFYKKDIVINNEYIILTTDVPMCIYRDHAQVIDNLTINVHTKLKVEETNADKVDQASDLTYTWEIDGQNYKNKTIYLKLKKDDKINDKSALIKGIITGLGILIIILIGIMLAFKIKNKKSNEI